jgi:DNA polymerase III epsilon subunit-like protein
MILSTSLITEDDYNHFISYHPLDTLVISQYYKLIGLLPTHLSVSLSSLCQFAKIQLDYQQTHTAHYDTLLTIELLKFLKSKIRLVQKSNPSVQVLMNQPKITLQSPSQSPSPSPSDLNHKKRKLTDSNS